MAFKVFLDANLLLDLTLRRKDFQAAHDIMRLGISGDLLLYTTPAVLHITAYFTSQAYSVQQTKEILLTLLNDVRIIDCDHATAVTALSSNMEDIEDALLYFTAIKFKLDFFISSDQKFKKAAIPQLPVSTAAELFEKLNKG